MPTVNELVQIDLQRFVFNEHALRELLIAPTGAVSRDLIRRAIRVEAAAKRNATNRPGPRVRTGRLRGSITWRHGFDSVGPYVDVGTAVEYSLFVELGTSRAPAYPYLRPALEAARA